MSVSDGQPVDAATVNAAFISRTQDTSTVGKVALQNGAPESGPFISNPQQAINETFDTVGIAGLGDPNAKNYSSTNVVSNGMSRKEAIEALDAEVGTLGTIASEYPVHNHDGVNTPQISATSLLDINQLQASWQAETVIGASGFTSDITALFALKADGLGGTQLGVISLPPHNKCLLFDPTTGTNFEDVDGTRVFARVTFDGLNWTLTYLTNKAGVETPYEFLAPTDIQFFYLEVFNLASRPTVPSSPDFFTLDVTADVVDATTTQRGVVSTTTQSFAGDKTFQDSVTVQGDLSIGGLNVGQTLDKAIQRHKVTFTYDQFSDPTPVFQLIAKTLAAGEMIHQVMLQVTTPFLGAGVLWASIGDSAGVNKEKYSSKFDLISASDFFLSISFGFESLDLPSDAKLYLESDVNLDLLTAGEIDIYLWTSKG